MKTITVRKLKCGHWTIIRCAEHGDYYYFIEEAHVDDFTDILLILNGLAEVVR